MTEKPTNIEEVLLRLQQERPVLAKTSRGQVGNQLTRYADLVQVNDVVLKILNDLGTIWTCRPTLEDGVFGLHYSLEHVPSLTSIQGVWPLTVDKPQQMGSAVTYGRRYALLAVTGIVAEDEDDDGAAASKQRPTRRQAAAEPAPKTRPTTSIQRANPAAPELITAGQSAKLHALFNGMGITKEERAERLAITAQVIGHDVATSNELTKAEATKVIDHLQNLAEPLPDEPPLDDA